MKMTVDPEKCTQDHICEAIPVCPAGAIVQEGCSTPVIRKELCTQCAKCALFCKRGAIHMTLGNRYWKEERKDS